MKPIKLNISPENTQVPMWSVEALILLRLAMRAEGDLRWHGSTAGTASPEIAASIEQDEKWLEAARYRLWTLGLIKER